MPISSARSMAAVAGPALLLRGAFVVRHVESVQGGASAEEPSRQRRGGRLVDGARAGNSRPADGTEIGQLVKHSGHGDKFAAQKRAPSSV